MKQTLKIGQKYRVILDSENPCREGTIVNVSRIGKFNCFYDENGKFFDMDNDELQLVKPKTKKVKKEIDWSIDVRYEKDVLKAFDKFIEKWCGENSSHLLDSDEQDGEFMRDKIRKLLATQPQPIKEECGKINGSRKGVQNISGTPFLLEKCTPNKHYFNGNNTCSCGSMSVCTPSPQEESKDIEPFKTVFTYSKNYPDLCATQTDEFRKWVKQVTDTLNSLTKRK